MAELTPERGGGPMAAWARRLVEDMLSPTDLGFWISTADPEIEALGEFPGKEVAAKRFIYDELALALGIGPLEVFQGDPSILDPQPNQPFTVEEFRRMSHFITWLDANC